MEVYFKWDQEVISFCESLFCAHKQIELHWKTDDTWGNHLQLQYEVLDQKVLHSVAQAFVDVYMKHRLSNALKKIIKKNYYYSDEDEVVKIHELTYDLLADSGQVKEQAPQEMLQNLFVHHMQDSSPLNYDSIVKFRLQSFYSLLIYYVGLAIDEYKGEEDYQAFIDNLRKYIAKKKPTYDKIFILQGENFSFFKENGERFSSMDLRKLIHKEPLYMIGLDIEEFNLSPLIALAPRKIFIYGDHPTDPKTVTVMNVFQERVHFARAAHFPFAHS